MKRTALPTPQQAFVSRRNEEIVAVLNQATPMLKRLAFAYEMEYDELYQLAALTALEHYEKAQSAQNPRAFLYGIIRNIVWYRPKEAATFSLDVNVSADSDTTYADLLPAPDLPAFDTKREERRTRALYDALRRLPLEEQTYLCRVHELNAYRPTRPTKGRFAGRRPNLTRPDTSISQHAYTWLRRNRTLAEAIFPSSGQAPTVNLDRDGWWEETEEGSQEAWVDLSADEPTTSEVRELQLS